MSVQQLLNSITRKVNKIGFHRKTSVQYFRCNGRGFCLIVIDITFCNNGNRNRNDIFQTIPSHRRSQPKTMIFFLIMKSADESSFKHFLSKTLPPSAQRRLTLITNDAVIFSIDPFRFQTFNIHKTSAIASKAGSNFSFL